MRKSLMRVSMFDGVRSLPIEQEVERLLADDKPVVGVSYHRGKRKWRAYIYSGRVQIDHEWCETKREAITARLQMVTIHGRPRVLVQGKDVPYRAFPRTVPAPKEFVLDDVLFKMHSAADNISMVLVMCQHCGMNSRDYKRIPVDSRLGNISNRRVLGQRIGMFITVVELLSMAGEVKVEHIEEGMRAMAEELGGRTGTNEGDENSKEVANG